MGTPTGEGGRTRPPGRGRLLSALTGAAGVLAAALFAPAVPAVAAGPADGVIRHTGGPTAVVDSYLVVFKDARVSATAVRSQARETADRSGGGTVVRTYRHALRGFELTAPAAVAKRIAADPAVAFVEQNHRVRVRDTQSPTPSWGLDRIDQRSLPLNNSYTYPVIGSGVRAYVVDTGIRFSHTAFGGRAVSGFDAIDGGSADDCHGHGTHVAGTVGGGPYGVAKGVTLVAVRVLDCVGDGTWGQVMAGVDWVAGDHDPGELAVANMSIGGPADSAINLAVARAIDDGVTFAVAAGNDNINACGSSPASEPKAITVAATGGAEGSYGGNDARASFSNYGNCVDIFAPGVNITSSTMDSNTSSDGWDGTSMASPHVAGAAALVLAQNPSFTPQQIRDHLVNNGTTGVVTSPGAGSPNVLLYVPNAPPPAHDFAIALSPADGATEPGGSVTATVATTVTAGSGQPVTLAASGLPAGATASFTPSSITSGGSATLVVQTGAATPPGSYPVTVTGTGSYAARTATFTLTVTGPPGCSQSNPTDVTIEDESIVESAVTVAGCAGNASATSTVEVHIVHTWVEDLILTLLAPDGSSYLLRGLTGGGADNVDETYTVNLAGEAANGTWRLRVEDVASQDTGFIDSWTLNLAGGGTPVRCVGSNPTDVTIPDMSTVTSGVTIAGCAGNASATSTVEVHIVHTWIGDLVVSLVAPDGSVYVLHDRAGGSTQDIDETYTLDLSGEARAGTWRLRVRDAATGDTGHLDSWALTL
ncbi:S8 family peptidase [Plantactinospora endophytica]|uniref:P/Homo B domain-containing protein n=1 Tax=Plantactinospora endophytica TaxID=673535 RepID=A0ABQ4EE90_9ACTN|nr:S8 family peptidase [Plantactinospora endophytica]GIG93042.1 hypothetical protein Pen02_79780 [Plantactinospora endophytica]